MKRLRVIGEVLLWGYLIGIEVAALVFYLQPIPQPAVFRPHPESTVAAGGTTAFEIELSINHDESERWVTGDISEESSEPETDQEVQETEAIAIMESPDDNESEESREGETSEEVPAESTSASQTEMEMTTELAESTPEKLDISKLKAGTRLSKSDVSASGVNAYFFEMSIDETIFSRMKNKSYGADCVVPITDLRYVKVLHYSRDGNIYVGELVCHRDISKSLLSIFRQLYDHKYPIQKMHLVDDYGGADLVSAAANNTSCFNYRVSAGQDTGLSNHAFGKAIDINPLYNPYIWWDSEGEQHCEPEESRPYADRNFLHAYKLEEHDLCVRLFKEHGFKWGGDWKWEKDYMHFSK